MSQETPKGRVRPLDLDSRFSGPARKPVSVEPIGGLNQEELWTQWLLGRAPHPLAERRARRAALSRRALRLRYKLAEGGAMDVEEPTEIAEARLLTATHNRWMAGIGLGGVAGLLAPLAATLMGAGGETQAMLFAGFMAYSLVGLAAAATMAYRTPWGTHQLLQDWDERQREAATDRLEELQPTVKLEQASEWSAVRSLLERVRDMADEDQIALAEALEAKIRKLLTAREELHEASVDDGSLGGDSSPDLAEAIARQDQAIEQVIGAIRSLHGALTAVAAEADELQLGDLLARAEAEIEVTRPPRRTRENAN